MLIKNGTGDIWLIGDPHFGRNFNNGTPLHRRGDRERMQREQFIEELNHPASTIVMVGDLMDKPVVPLNILSQVIQDVKAVALERYDVDFIFMAGNHDKSRQLEQMGAWEIFSMAVGWIDNVHIIDDYMVINDVAYFAWNWSCTSKQQVERFLDYEPGRIDAFVGHWDLMDFGGDTSHMCPVDLFQQINPLAPIYSGHYHIEGTHTVDGVNVNCTGSMQPYAHGEGDMYVTLTVDEALARDDLYDKCVRIVLQPGEILPDIDCLQLTSTREAAVDEPIEIEISTVFNMHDTLELAFAENEVPEQVQIYIKEKLSDPA